ncbi:MAG TPA: Coenzyme F420 hydrogenase/dehydrogenase, beta subunit C-terminal domain [Candidatus Nanoarchaeia archaeon]|nr:Coenzyme F420 hydrogenase/dehydrogenase, beta subunit C-terminal domain [Candidatus Nanoarchaeia archaeon]
MTAQNESHESLIAYNVLNKKIISQGFCTLCGACEAACPTSAISVENERNRHVYDCSKDLDLCPICYETCPHSERLQLRAQKAVSDAPARSEAIGYYRKIVLAQANDAKLRERCRGGGVVTSLLTYGVENKVFDSAIVSKAEPENPTQPKAEVATVQDDILSAVGSKFFPSPVAKAYGRAVYGYGKTKIAFVGVPCHVLALRKIEAWHHKIGDNLAITIGLFCFGTFSMTPLLKYVEDNYHVKPSEIKRIRLSRTFVVETEKEKIKIPVSEVENHIMPSCRTCQDFTSELADISIGGAYPLEDWSTVIIRTKRGEDFFYDAVAHGVISTWVIEQEPEVYERVVRAAMQKRTAGLQEAKKIEEKLGYLPVVTLTESDSLAKVKVADIMSKKVQTVRDDITVTELLSLMVKQRHIGYPVLNAKNEPVGIVTVEEASQVETSQRDKTTVQQIIARKPISVSPDNTALDAFRKMSEFETGRLIVVDPTEPNKILGMVTKSDLMHTMIEQC